MLLAWIKPRQTAALYLLGVSLLLPAQCLAQSSELESLKATVKGMEQQLQKALSRIEQLEKEKAVDSGQRFLKLLLHPLHGGFQGFQL